jgi:hypothetical protein
LPGRTPASILQRNQALVKTFHREGHCRARRNAIEYVSVAEFVGFGNHLQVADTAIRAKCTEGFIVRATVRRWLAVDINFALPKDTSAIKFNPAVSLFNMCDNEYYPSYSATVKKS